VSDLPRKTTERIALTQAVNVRDLQHFIGQSHWSCPSVIAHHQGCVRTQFSVVCAHVTSLTWNVNVLKMSVYVGHLLAFLPHYDGSVG
jgi:hypothetical protein